MSTARINPEHAKTIQPAIDLIIKQTMTIERLKEALVGLRSELEGIVSDLEGEDLAVISTLQDMLYDALDMLEEELSDASSALPSSSFASSSLPQSSSSFSCSSSHPSSSAAPVLVQNSSASPPPKTPSKKVREGAEALASVKEVYRLENQGKSAEASAKLQSLPQGTHVQEQTIANASRAMEQVLFSLGGLETISRVLDSFFKRPAVRTSMSEHLKSTTSSEDQSTVDDIIATAKSFFTGIMQSSGRRTDINMNAFWAVAAALVPVTALEDRKVRSVMRVLNLRFEVVKRAIDLRNGMVDSAVGWKLIRTTSEHSDKRQMAELIKWLHSEDASTPDNEHKVEHKVMVSDKDGVLSFELHQRRYYNDNMLALRKRFLMTPAYERMRAAHLEVEERKRHVKALKAAKAMVERGVVPRNELVEAEKIALRVTYKNTQAERLARQKLRQAGLDRQPRSAEVTAEFEAAPEICELVIGKKQFQDALCQCTFSRKGGECDCPHCSYMTYNTGTLRRCLINFTWALNQFAAKAAWTQRKVSVGLLWTCISSRGIFFVLP